jgi:hypothetical protein
MTAGVSAPIKDTSDASFFQMLGEFSSKRWISEVNLDTKIFVYVVSRVLDRATGKMPLQESVYEQLHRHLWARTTLDRIDALTGVSLATRQVLIWDMPNFNRTYKHIELTPIVSAAPKKRIKKLRIKGKTPIKKKPKLSLRK